MGITVSRCVPTASRGKWGATNRKRETDTQTWNQPRWQTPHKRAITSKYEQIVERPGCRALQLRVSIFRRDCSNLLWNLWVRIRRAFANSTRPFLELRVDSMKLVEQDRFFISRHLRRLRHSDGTLRTQPISAECRQERIPNGELTMRCWENSAKIGC